MSMRLLQYAHDLCCCLGAWVSCAESVLCSVSVDVTEVRERSESWLATPIAILGLPASGV